MLLVERVSAGSSTLSSGIGHRKGHGVSADVRYFDYT